MHILIALFIFALTIDRDYRLAINSEQQVRGLIINMGVRPARVRVALQCF